MVFDIDKAMKGKRSHWAVLGGTARTQVAVMVLGPGEASSLGMSVHPGEDQVLYVNVGELCAEIGGEQLSLTTGQCVIVPANTPHRFVNVGSTPAYTLNIYAPPAY